MSAPCVLFIDSNTLTFEMFIEMLSLFMSGKQERWMHGVGRCLNMSKFNKGMSTKVKEILVLKVVRLLRWMGTREANRRGTRNLVSTLFYCIKCFFFNFKSEKSPFFLTGSCTVINIIKLSNYTDELADLGQRVATPPILVGKFTKKKVIHVFGAAAFPALRTKWWRRNK